MRALFPALLGCDNQVNLGFPFWREITSLAAKLLDPKLFHEQAYIDGAWSGADGGVGCESSKYGLDEFMELKYILMGSLSS